MKWLVAVSVPEDEYDDRNIISVDVCVYYSVCLPILNNQEALFLIIIVFKKGTPHNPSNHACQDNMRDTKKNRRSYSGYNLSPYSTLHNNHQACFLIRLCHIYFVASFLPAT